MSKKEIIILLSIIIFSMVVANILIPITGCDFMTNMIAILACIGLLLFSVLFIVTMISAIICAISILILKVYKNFIKFEDGDKINVLITAKRNCLLTDHNDNSIGMCISIKRALAEIGIIDRKYEEISDLIPEFNKDNINKLSSIYNFDAPDDYGKYWWNPKDFLTRIKVFDALIDSIKNKNEII